MPNRNGTTALILVVTVSAIAARGSTQTGDPAPAPDAAQVGYDGGFFLRSADGRNELVIEGLMQVGLNLFQPDRGRVSEFDLRRIRPELAGRIDDAFRFKIEPKFSEDDVELEEAWAGIDLAGGDARLMLGRMKAPFNLEEVRSRRHMDFPRFSILNQLAPAEDHGVFVNGTTADNAIEYGLAFYNGTGAADTTSSKDLAIRAAWRPMVDQPGSAWSNLHFGAAMTWGRQNALVAGDSIVNAFDQSVIDFAPGTRLHGERWRSGLEFAWFDGPIFLQSEVLWMRQDMRSGAGSAHVDFYGAYVSASWVVTGETRDGWSGVRPESPFDPKDGVGRGAWVIALRLSELAADTALRDLGFATPGRYTERIRSASLGLNWVLNRHLIARHAYVHSFYSDDVALGNGTHGDEGALMVEWQLHF